ncbi:MAG: GNAT family N-acetyltransferase [Hyphomicrobiales bacterium]|nr:GNAT family N-acetyltransferase [Hyphomicrobiales bacterium]
MSITLPDALDQTVASARLDNAPSDAAPDGSPAVAVLPLPGSGMTVETHSDLAGASAAWAELEEAAPCSIYQTRRFMVPWLQTIAPGLSMHPMLTIVRNGNGDPLALFPFGVRKSAGVRIIEFLGGSDSNVNMALYRPGTAFDAIRLREIIRLAAQASGLRPALASLRNQPLVWNRQPNPLSLLPHRPSPSQCHAMLLLADGETFRNRQLSKDYRKKLRAKQRKLGEMGELKFLTADTEAEAHRILDAFYDQKLQRFEDKNIASEFDTPESREFFIRSCVARVSGRGAAVELHALECGGRIVATFGGGEHQGRFSGMFNSFDQSPAFARHSPGDILLSHLVDRKCEAGLHVFDLGIGESRYKQIWCDAHEDMFDTVMGLTAAGHAMAQFFTARQMAKRAIKQSSWAWPLLLKLREKVRLR